MPIPNQTAIVSYPVPVIADRVLFEYWNTTVAEYVALEIGAPHPNTREFPGYKLGKQQALPNSEKMIQRIWVTDATNQNLYNYALKYSAQSASHPIFIRSYRERKDTYAPRTRGVALQVVYRIALTAAGSGYSEAAIATLAGGAGSGATARVVLNQDKTITEIVLTAGGDSFTSAPTVTISDTGGGTGATATAYIQPTAAVLVEEEPQQFDPSSEYYGQYFNVMRVWETLPGPVLADDFYDEERGAVQKTVQRIAATGSEVGSLAYSAPTVTEISYTSESSVVLRRITETWALPGPLLTSYEEDFETRVNIKVTKQRIVPVAKGIPVLGIEEQHVRLNIVETRQIIRTFDATALAALLGAQPVTYKRGTFAFPTLFYGLIDPLYVVSDDSGKSVPTLNYSLRGGFSRRVPIKVTTTFSTTEPTPPALFEIKTSDYRYNGLAINISLSDVLSDGYVANVPPGPYLGIFTDGFSTPDESYFFTASGMTQSTYTAAIGTWQVIDYEIERPERYGGLWRMQTFSVKML